MLMTAAQQNYRLKHEYQAMCAFPINNLFTWKIAPGQTPPRIHSYLVTYHVYTMIKENGKSKKSLETIELLITLGDNPSGIPTVRIIRGKIPFHPNIYLNGSFCLGDLWLKEPFLWKLVINLGKVLAFDPAHTNPDSPANAEAAQDWKIKQSGIRKPYPCGDLNYPHPAGY